MQQINVEWGGHGRGIAQASHWDDNSLPAQVGPDTAYDLTGELRLLNRTSLGRDWIVQTHYLARLRHGDSLETRQKLHQLLPDQAGLTLLPSPVQTDRTQLFDLARTVHQGERTRLNHGLDRLNLSVIKPWGTLRLGRQALTWGNGLLFHPMDLFNPFSPTAVLTDYKTGQDMATLLLPLGSGRELHLLAVPRRKPSNRSIHWEASSVAGKAHFVTSSLEIDAMAAHHYQALVTGLGLAGTVGSAAWRMDLTWTEPEDDQGYLSAVLNLDRSWFLAGKNWYGFLEFFYSGLGEDEPEQALANPELLRRLERGELFTLSQAYLAGSLEVELHPLLRGNVTLISNLKDASGLVQPTLRWDVATDVELIAGTSLYYGGRGTEFGGFDLQTPLAQVSLEPADSVFAWLTVYF